jgi:quercetin dioxygenase-like cupin family protein
MSGQFIPNAAASRDDLSWGFLRWFSRPETTQASNLVVIEVAIDPGFGHNFHKHPDQEEVLYVLDGQVEQWLEKEKRILHPGDAIFIGKNVVHASFNHSSRPAKFLAILGPCVTADGYVSVEVGDEAPWKDLR